MDVREKLVELLDEAEEWADHKCDELDCETCYAGKMKGNCVQKLMVDRLIGHGVTVQEWISVKDRLPEESGMYIVTANDGHAQRVSFVQWQKKNRMWNLTGARSYWRVTHWMPLPEPPKGE